MTVIYDVNGIISSGINVTNNLYNLADISPRTLCCADIYAVSSCNNFRFIGPPFRVCGQTLHAEPASVSNLMVPSYTIGIGSFSLMWDPPLNLNTTPGVTYNVAINNQSLRDLTDATFLYIKDLSPCTIYTVEVIARFSGQSGPGSMTSVTTRSLLPPPENVAFFNANGMLGLMWLRPSELACEDNIQRYRLSLRCNQFVNETEISSAASSVGTNIPDDSLGIGWCVARMQSCDAVRCGNFSSEATASLYQSPPSQPRCLLLQSTSTNVSISFLVSQPFITNSTRIEWNLTRTSIRLFETDSYDYNVSSTNILDFTVDSNSDYDFKLKICDIYGCSSPCVITFKTLVSLVVIVEGGDIPVRLKSLHAI